jgi:hypothetical protein
MDCGTRDEYFLHLGSRQMSRRLTQLGLQHTYEEFEAGHANVRFRYDDSLSAISSAMPG